MSGTTPLYAVDPDGTTTPSDPGPPAGGGAQPAKAKARPRPKFPVPTDRLSFERQELALRVVVTLSRAGQHEVTAADMGASMSLSAATAPLNNAFFVDVGLMEKIGKQGYKPTDLAIRYQQKWTFDREAAPKELAPGFRDAWFFTALRDQLAINPTTTTKKKMVEVLANVAGTDSSYSTQYQFCLEWLEYVGLVLEVEGTLRLAEEFAGEARPDEVEAPSETSPETSFVPAAEAVRPPAAEGKPTQDRPPAVVSLSMEVYLTADDLAKLGADEIKALFSGAAEIAAVNAKLA